MASGLDQAGLKSKIADAIQDTLIPALKQAFHDCLPEESEDGEDLAEKFSSTVDDLFTDSFAEELSSAIDYYVKTAEIFGKFQILGVATVGSMCAQSQVVPLPITVDTMPTGMGGGNMPMPNTLYLGIK